MNFSQLDAKTQHVQVSKTQSVAVIGDENKTNTPAGSLWEGAYNNT